MHSPDGSGAQCHRPWTVQDPVRAGTVAARASDMKSRNVWIQGALDQSSVLVPLVVPPILASTSRSAFVGLGEPIVDVNHLPPRRVCRPTKTSGSSAPPGAACYLGRWIGNTTANAAEYRLPMLRTIVGTITTVLPGVRMLLASSQTRLDVISDWIILACGLILRSI